MARHAREGATTVTVVREGREQREVDGCNGGWFIVQKLSHLIFYLPVPESRLKEEISKSFQKVNQLNEPPRQISCDNHCSDALETGLTIGAADSSLNRAIVGNAFGVSSLAFTEALWAPLHATVDPWGVALVVIYLTKTSFVTSLSRLAEECEFWRRRIVFTRF